ncbi:hypothetical protein FHS78_001510 [Parvibaculum indicum]|uniref:DUF1302 domain-containing protein n=1 Tax=Parvibaculum indicum TaxID=562969 RepID=UPI0014205981|nr:DUF1302 domain-containing protein [Parvibaculum indicum]NIJ41223.1 hypothetical protein [Parvibaculum indicum]
MIKRSLRSALLFGGVVATALGMSPQVAQATQLKVGDVDITVDNTVSFGVGIRASNQNCEHIAIVNGGCPAGNGVSMGVNDDDGNINNGPGVPYTMTGKITTDISARYENFGAFLRIKGFYDYWADEHVGKRSSGYGTRPLEDAVRGSDAHLSAARDLSILDAYVYGNFDLLGRPVTLRVGKQVVNWGESLFIPGGISSYLPMDLSALRTPGSELKEAFQPIPAVYFNMGLPANFSIEAFWQFDWEKLTLDPAGTFFSGSDAGGEGGRYVQFIGEYPHQVTLPRTADEQGEDTSTWGVALRYYADWLNDGTDMGLYVNRYSLVAPVGSFTAANLTVADTILGRGAPTGGPTTLYGGCNFLAGGGLPETYGGFLTCAGTDLGGGTTALETVVGAAAMTKHYLLQYPMTTTFGFSFNTLVPIMGGSALSGEVSYSPNMPFALSDTNINCNDLANADLGGFTGVPNSSLCETYNPAGYGDAYRGYARHDVINGQLGLISTLNPSSPVVSTIGADVMFMVMNAGFQYLPDFDSATSGLGIPRAANRANSPFTTAILGDEACSQIDPTTGAFVPGACQAKYASQFSSGYRLAFSAQYNNAFDTPWTLTPNINFAHDVTGYSAGPVGPGFVQDKKAVSVGLTADLQSVWKANISYTHNWGNPFRNFSSDKDFVAASISYAF